MRLNGADLYADRKHDDIRLCVHRVILRRGQAVFRRKLYELYRQYGLLMSIGTGGDRVRKLYEARMPDGWRLRRGETMSASGNDNGIVRFLCGERTVYMSVGLPGERFGFLYQACLS